MRGIDCRSRQEYNVRHGALRTLVIGRGQNSLKPYRRMQMKKYSLLLVTFLLLLITLLPLPALSQGQSVAKGVWEGAITISGMELAIVVTLDRKEDGSWRGKIDIPAQKAQDLALGNIIGEGLSVSFMILGIPGDPAFKGNLAADGNLISGDFTQGGQTFPFKLTRKTETKSALPAQPQEETKPDDQTANIEGTWWGSLNVRGGTLKLVLRVLKAPDGALTAKLDSPDQGALDLPVDTITLVEGTVRFEMKQFGATYEGTLSKDGAEISGKWTQGGTPLPLVLKRTEQAVKLKRPQEPQKPYPYDEEEVAYENKKAGIKLTGSLTLPRSQGPFPTVLLVTGSGPQDRDETVAGHKPFLVLADYVTRQGLAVLRVDDRGTGGSTGNVNEATTEEFADDVLVGVEYLKGRKEINAQRIGLIGHSEGGAVAAIAASKSNDIAFIVMMAGPGLTGEEILYLQRALIAKAHGRSDTEIAEDRAAQERVYSVLKTEKDRAAAEKKLRELGHEFMAAMTEEQRKAGSSKAVEGQLKGVLTPWF